MFWIPIIGPIIQGIVSLFTKVEDTKLEIHKADVNLDTQIVQSSTNITSVFHDDIGVRFTRDIILFPVAIWMGFVTWNNIVVYKYPDLIWTVAAYPPSLAELPYAVMVFLFGVTAMNIWRR
jgi:hypothetical protein